MSICLLLISRLKNSTSIDIQAWQIDKLKIEKKIEKNAKMLNFEFTKMLNKYQVVLLVDFLFKRYRKDLSIDFVTV